VDLPTESELAAGPELVANADASATGGAGTAAAADPLGAVASSVPVAGPRAGEAVELRAAVIGPAIRTWLRYLVPLTLLSALALSPLIAIALGTRAPADLAAAKAVASRGWTLLAFAWLGQLVLVGGASAILAAPRSQLRALGAGVVQLVRAIVPCLIAAAAIAIGCLALVVPGLVLLVLLSLTGASRERGLPAPLLDSISAARRQLPAMILAVAALFAIDALIGVLAHRAFIAALPPKPTPAQLAGARDFVRAMMIALVIVSPLPATVLAALGARLEPPPAATQAESR
jgi:hypothetical protein